ncbi:type II toxin-antitoxin system RelE/ParE family toxin [uncultured Pantoea sp.]|uniref:type II toxin-antitoxin system RelE/ParE family toxin n=1 Tax=uncultured Pantoea sp. TaxID=218084 RepID=UPI0027D9ADA4|nr:type II toxin-antitoxin system RelE/ParE family toxin [uncultured Pantoea sp.]
MIQGGHDVATLRNIDNFRDEWLRDFFLYGKHSGKIPMALSSALARKLDIINAAVNYQDLRSPPGNRYEELNPPLKGYAAIRVNEQYRLIFKWIDGKAVDLYLDPHSYKKHK